MNLKRPPDESSHRGYMESNASLCGLVFLTFEAKPLYSSTRSPGPQICVPAASWGELCLQNRWFFFSPTKIGGSWSIGISSILALMMDGNLGDSLRSLDPHDQKTKLEDCHEAAKMTIDMVTTEHVHEVLHHLWKKDHIISHQPKIYINDAAHQ